MSTHIHRVIVRGFFQDLDDAKREQLRASLADHDILRSAFTAAGTLTYGKDIGAFSFRFEVRTSDGDDGLDHTQAAKEIGMARAEAALRELGVAHRALRATATDMASMWR